VARAVRRRIRENAETVRESRTRGLAGFAQPFGVPADAGPGQGGEDRGMLLKSSIVDLGDRRSTPANALDVFEHPFAYAGAAA
jgi:hypothetical protein